MVLEAMKGALGFLTRLPIGRNKTAWDALGEHPATLVPVGYLVGVIASLPVLFLPAYTAAVTYPVAIIGMTGVTHMDGLADLADAAVIHGDAEDRRAIMKDTVTGVGGTVGIGLSLLAMALAAAALASVPFQIALGVIVAAEVSAKFAMVGLAVSGSPSYGGLGDHLLGASRNQLLVAGAVAIPAALGTWPSPAAAMTVIGGITVGAAIGAWAARALDGISGDVFGAVNELARLGGLHMGLIVWMHY